jgi:PAS domain-containing protein
VVTANQEAPQLSVSKLQEKGSLAEVIMRSAGLVAIAFNDEAETVYWSEGAQALTGLGQKDVPDLKTFTEKVFPHGKERKLFKHWLDSEPEDRSQELKIRTLDSILSSVRRAGEWNDADTGELGMLWTRLDPPRILGGQKAASLDEGEPAIPSDDS